MVKEKPVEKEPFPCKVRVGTITLMLPVAQDTTAASLENEVLNLNTLTPTPNTLTLTLIIGPREDQRPPRIPKKRKSGSHYSRPLFDAR